MADTRRRKRLVYPDITVMIDEQILVGSVVIQTVHDETVDAGTGGRVIDITDLPTTEMTEAEGDQDIRPIEETRE